MSEQLENGRLRLWRLENLIAGVLALLLTAAEARLYSVYSAGSLSSGELALVHLTLLIFPTVLFLWTWRGGRDLRLPLILLTSVAVMGPVGAAGTVLCLLAGLLFSLSATPFEEWYRALFPAEESRFSRDVFEQILATGTSTHAGNLPTPFVDVLTYGTVEQKQTVITLISKHFKPSFAPTLLRALQDRSNAIRVQAATAMARIEHGFSARTLELEEQRTENPEEESLILAEACHFDDYAATGLLDRTREIENREKAREGYEEYLSRHAGDERVRVALGRILVRQRRYEEAAVWFERSLDKDGSPNAFAWLMECLYHLGRHDELRKLARSQMKRFTAEQLPGRTLQVVRLWAGHSLSEVPDG